MDEPIIIWKDGSIEKLLLLEDIIEEFSGEEDDEENKEYSGEEICLIFPLRDVVDEKLRTSLGAESYDIPPDMNVKELVKVIGSLIEVLREKGANITSVIVSSPTSSPYMIDIDEDNNIEYHHTIYDIQEIDSVLGNVFSDVPENLKSALDDINEDDIPENIRHFDLQSNEVKYYIYSYLIGKPILEKINDSQTIIDALKKRASLYDEFHKTIAELKKYKVNLYLFVQWSFREPLIPEEYMEKYTFLYYGISERSLKYYDLITLEYPLKIKSDHLVLFFDEWSPRSIIKTWCKENVLGLLTEDEFMMNVLYRRVKEGGEAYEKNKIRKENKS